MWMFHRDAASLNAIRQMDPELILSSHLPAARGMNERLLGTLATAPNATPWVGPDQEALMQMMAQITGDESRAEVTV